MQLWVSATPGSAGAVDQLTVKLQFGSYRYVVEADIKGFFDNISHEWLMRMLAERIDDQAILPGNQTGRWHAARRNHLAAAG